jgi:hypothetical protein
MDSARDTRALPRVGFPIRRSRGQRLVSTSPGLIAAAHVLHRLSAPRHPPCALVLLIRKNTCVMSLWSFQGAVGPRRLRGSAFSRPTLHGSASSRPAELSPSKLNSVLVEVDVVLGESGHRTSEDIERAERLADKSPPIPRKEVIQPQLPLRLPCYDFTPIIDPTFDGSLPCGLGHRLRVLPTFVV